MYISETDTGALYRWDGATWEEQSVAALGNDEVALANLGIGTAKGEFIVIRSANQPVLLSVGSNGETIVAASGETDGVRWHHPTIPIDSNTKTDGSVTVTATSWANVDNALDLTIPAENGDWVGVHVNGLWQAASGIAGRLDAMVVNSSNYVSGAAFGVRSWTSAVNEIDGIGGEILYQVVSGDISGGNVQFRLRAHISAAGSKVLSANTNSPLQFACKNYGH
jgi:hypothetical protein